MNRGIRHAALSHQGRRRTDNEDRLLEAPELGVFGVVDGVGGHAAGEKAAETAVEVIREWLSRRTGSPEVRLREAIALANNEIFALSRANPEWQGMACVLTVALIEDGVVTVGHVGDSRLYLIEDGRITKKTHDHSPVGEREDRGELSESEAMRHSRRNEIYRDVGTQERTPDEPGFIEIIPFPMPDNGALVLCSDGLSDLVDSGKILAGVNRYASDPEQAVRALVDAANQAGGKDNISVVLVAGTSFSPVVQREPVRKPGRARGWLEGALIALGCFAVLFYLPVLQKRFDTGPHTIALGNDSIAAAMAKAHSGDTVIIPPGTFREDLHLAEGVAVRVQQFGKSVLLGTVTAKGLHSGSLEGLIVQGDRNHPPAYGVKLDESSVTIANIRVSGAVTGIVVSGHSDAVVAASQITNNFGAGVEVTGDAKPRLEGNLIAANGNGSPDQPRPGIAVTQRARPVLKDNAIVNNAAEPVWVDAPGYDAQDFEENFFGGLTGRKAIRTSGAEVKP